MLVVAQIEGNKPNLSAFSVNVIITLHSLLNGCQLNLLHLLECGLAFSELSVVDLLI